VEAQLETERQPTEGQRDEANSDGFTSSDTLEELDIVHVIGDIVQVHCCLCLQMAY
jgi:hypothetical protein